MSRAPALRDEEVVALCRQRPPYPSEATEVPGARADRFGVVGHAACGRPA